MRASAGAEPQRSPKGVAFWGVAEADALIRSGAPLGIGSPSAAGIVTLVVLFSVFFSFQEEFSLDVRL